MKKPWISETLRIVNKKHKYRKVEKEYEQPDLQPIDEDNMEVEHWRRVASHMFLMQFGE